MSKPRPIAPANAPVPIVARRSLRSRVSHTGSERGSLGPLRDRCRRCSLRFGHPQSERLHEAGYRLTPTGSTGREPTHAETARAGARPSALRAAILGLRGVTCANLASGSGLVRAQDHARAA